MIRTRGLDSGVYMRLIDGFL